MIRQSIKFLSSLKLAVFIIIALAVLTAAGTIVESRYDAYAAAKLVYHTWMMYSVLGLLCVVLIAVMIDRWPWKPRHIPFILAHIGIIVLLVGSLVTKLFGLDGSMRFGMGQSNRYVTIPETEIQIWATFDGDRPTRILNQEADFYVDPPKENPIRLQLGQDEFVIDDYEPYVLATRQIVAGSSAKLGSAVRFQIQNENVNVNDWLLQPREGAGVARDFGPARISLGNPLPESPKENALYLNPKSQKEVEYTITYKDKNRKALKGILSEGGAVPTGWMGLEFKLLRYFPKAEEKYELKPAQYPTPLTTSAIQINFQGKKHWVQLNDILKLFTQDTAYIISYQNRRVDLGFDLQLKKFEIGRYQGTMRAASYQSLVTTPDGKDTLISMNEPLKYRGLTFYQASFEDGPDGQPVASILSVNYDPGRWLKYLGSFILSLGTVWLFYNKRKAARAAAPRKGSI